LADSDNNDLKPATKLVTGGRRDALTGGRVVNAPVWRASTHLYRDVAELRAAASADDERDFFYGRRGSPTQWSLEEALTELEPGAYGTMLYPSGVAAISGALISILKPGDVLLMSDNAYDPSRNVANGLLKNMGVETRFFDPMKPDGISNLFCENTRAILLESPGSLTFEICDVPAICVAAKAYKAKREIITLLDNTWATPLLFNALEKGIDMSILAATKYVVGHSDAMMGSVTTHKALWKRLRNTGRQLGQVTSPDDAYLAARGLRTMGVRLKAHGEAALKIAKWLKAQDAVDRVLHPALSECPGHENWQRDFNGASGLFSFTIKGSQEKAAALIDALNLFGIGYSWGGYESLALPVYPEKYRSAKAWTDKNAVIRLNIGLEDADDLIADLASGFDAAKAIA